VQHPRRHVAVLVLAGAAFLAFTACSNGLDPDSPTALALQAVDDPTAIAQLAQDAPAPQAAILDDGQVSDDEYERALTAERDCVSAAGYEPSSLAWGDGELGFTVTASYEDEADPQAADAAFRATTDQCREENSTLVATIWANQD
jgi:hypothetical protein